MRNVVVFILVLLGNALSIRLYIDTVIEYKLNKNAIKKRKENRTIVKWVFYTQYRDVIPPIMLFWYFSELVLTIIAGIASFTLYLTFADTSVLNTFFIVCIIIAVVPDLFLIPFWGWHYGIPNKEQAAKLVDLKKRYHKKKKKHPLQKKK